jgi:murein DD-endopeptidase MepM/ murein hydrolase activator NlpD
VQAPPLSPTAPRAGADRTRITHIALPLSLAVTLLSLGLTLAIPGLGGATVLAGFMRPPPPGLMGLPNSVGSAHEATHLAPAPLAPAATGRVPPLHPPVEGPLVRGFEEPAGPYGPGHRGVDFAAAPGTPVRSPAAGRVTFAGPVAGTTWVTVEATPGVLVAVGPLRGVNLAVGDAVAVGEGLGSLAGGHSTTDPRTRAHATAAHLGLRVDGVYVDPLPWLAGLARPRLVPLSEPGGPH